MVGPETQPHISLQCLDAIRISLSIEKQGLAFYKKAAKNAKNKEVRELFIQLAEEEEEHIRLLSVKEKFLLPALKSRSDSMRQGLEQFMAEELKGKIFPVAKGKLAEIPVIEHDFEALDFGIESEKRSIELLNRLMKQERKIDVRVIFGHLVVEEKKHLAALRELKGKLPNRAA
ncbi:MAG: ferritin family protein [Nitrospinota bacterium]|nr:ferritin family protein [Nitrospinota bacterium]